MTDLPASRELDALVAQKVMGWAELRPAWWKGKYECFGFPPGEATEKMVPWYSTDIAVAWKMVEAMQARGCMLNVNVYVHAVEARFFQSEARADISEPIVGDFVGAETAPLAICRAALATVGATP